MGVIQDFIDEDREFREQLRKIRRDEIKQLEDIVSSRFDKEAHVSKVTIVMVLLTSFDLIIRVAERQRNR